MKQVEMESIYRSYEWLIREKLEQLDTLSRNMFTEMGTFDVKAKDSRKYVQQKFKELAIQISREGDERGKSRTRRCKEINQGTDKNLQTETS